MQSPDLERYIKILQAKDVKRNLKPGIDYALWVARETSDMIGAEVEQRFITGGYNHEEDARTESDDGDND